MLPLVLAWTVAAAAAPCGRPNLPASMVRAVAPDYPGAAMRAGAKGAVHIVVELDADSQVRSVAIQSSPSETLNAVSLAAAKASTYQTEIRDCVPVPARYVFTVEFSGVESFPAPPPIDPFLFLAGTWSCTPQGGMPVIETFTIDRRSRALVHASPHGSESIVRDGTGRWSLHDDQDGVVATAGPWIGAWMFRGSRGGKYFALFYATQAAGTFTRQTNSGEPLTPAFETCTRAPAATSFSESRGQLDATQ